MNNCPDGFFCLGTQATVFICIIIGLIIYYNYNKDGKNEVHQENRLESELRNEKIKNMQIEKRLEKVENNSAHNTEHIIENEERHAWKPPGYPIHATDPVYVVNKTHERASNPFLPPERSTPFTSPIGLKVDGIGVPINVPTRGYAGEFQQVGMLSNEKNDKVLALYGRMTYPGSGKWFYFTSTDKFHQVKIPVKNKSRDCTGEYGCEEIYSDDKVDVPNYGGEFKATIYSLDTPKYIPYLPY